MNGRYIDYLPSPVRKQLTLVPDTVRWSDEYDGGRRFVETAIHTNTDKNHWDSIVSVAIMNQSKSVYKYLRKTIPESYWIGGGDEHAFTIMITHGMYEWILEFRDKYWKESYGSGESGYDLLVAALYVFDSGIVELLLQWGVKIRPETISQAVWRVIVLGYYPTDEMFSGEPSNRIYNEMIDLLLPLRDKYNIDPDLLIE